MLCPLPHHEASVYESSYNVIQSSKCMFLNVCSVAVKEVLNYIKGKFPIT